MHRRWYESRDLDRVDAERGVSERLEQQARLCRTTRNLMRMGIRGRHPEYDDEAVELALLRLLLDDDAFFMAAKPGAPLLEP